MKREFINEDLGLATHFDQDVSFFFLIIKQIFKKKSYIFNHMNNYCIILLRI